MKQNALILVRGGGDLATGTIHRLWSAGLRVLGVGHGGRFLLGRSSRYVCAVGGADGDAADGRAGGAGVFRVRAGWLVVDTLDD